MEAIPEDRDRFDPERQALDEVEDGGGSALNVACALAAAGWRVVTAGMVGADEAGRAAIEALRRHGVDARIERAAGRRTKQVEVFVERRSGANAFRAVIPDHAAPPWDGSCPEIGGARWLLLDRPGARGIERLRGRRSDGVRSPGSGRENALLLNGPIHRPQAEERWRTALPLLSYLQIPETDQRDGPLSDEPEGSAGRVGGGGAGAGTGASAGASAMLGPATIHRPSAWPPLGEREIEEILSSGLAILARTRGARGAIVHQAGTRAAIEVPSRLGKGELVDPTGAGDAFAAGFLDVRLRGGPVEQAAATASDWAARACRHLGARAWLQGEPPR